jgi:exopolysaccharide biosynthesis polyprenyl glycosylphosphotransferase
MLLTWNGCFTRRPLGESFSTRSARVVRSAGALGVACWLAGIVVDESAAPQLLVPVVAALTLAVLLTSLVKLPGEAAIRIVVAGHPEDVRLAIAELAASPRVVVSAACVSVEPDVPLGSTPMHVGVSDAADLAKESGSDALLVLPGSAVTPPELRRLQWRADGTGLSLYIGTGLLDVSPVRVSVVQGAGLDLMQVRAVPGRGPRRLVKSALDRLLAGAALMILAPLLLAVAVMIRRDSPGPAIFCQQRVGRDGRCFTMYKFRTMSTSAESDLADLVEQNECDEVLFKMRSDPRITRIGGVLRRYSIDELPQLINVLVGNMSMVGPRPALPHEVDRYTDDPRRRLVVKPGITGLWQVSGRSDLTWDQSVRLDVRYVDNWSLSLDFRILCRTLGAVLSQRGAY